MASEAQNNALSKARASKTNKAVKVEPVAETKPEPVHLDVLHRDIEAYSHTTYQQKRLYVIAAFYPGVADAIHPTIFGGVTIRSGDRAEYMLSDGSRVEFEVQ